MNTMPLLLTLIAALAWAGTLQATSLAVVFLGVRKDPIPGRAVLVAQLGLVACLSTVVLLSHDESFGYLPSLERLELSGWLLAGPLFLHYIRRTLGLGTPSQLRRCREGSPTVSDADIGRLITMIAAAAPRD
ncbi:MAG: hypothetical protein VYE73_14865 [Acidobacteriota bacterium]|nr:hypothetical protein [Acidobacteriota bacterium]